MVSKKQITEVMNKISKKFNTKKIFLFGSYAYGQPSNDSDLDICIIIDLDNKRKIDMVRDIRRELSSLFKSPLDILLYEESEFNERANLKNTLEYKILKNGLMIDG